MKPSNSQDTKLQHKQRLVNGRSIPYGWLPFAIVPYESIWSLVQKFALWNCCTANELWHQFETQHKNKPQSSKSILRHRYFDLERFSSLLNIQPERIKQSQVDNYLFADEVEYLTSDTLRFCLRCLVKGFHSPIHQLLFIECCPYHDIPLLEGCPSCGTSISTTFNDYNISHPFQCQECNKMLLNPIILTRKTELEDRNIAFKKVSDWLITRKNLTESTERLSQYLSKSYSGALRRKRIRSLPLFWSEMLGLEPPFRMSSRVGGGVKKTEYKRHPNSIKESSFNEEKSIYITVCSHIISKAIRKHIKCFEEAKLWTGRWHYSFVFTGSRSCLLAQALIIWRMYWESLNMPSGINPIEVNCGYRHYCQNDYPDIFRDILTQELFEATFKESVLLAKYSRLKNQISYDYRYLNMRLCPYWVVKKAANSSSKVKMIVWRDRFPPWRSINIFRSQHFKEIQNQLYATFQG